jgi:hypothetical protein
MVKTRSLIFSAFLLLFLLAGGFVSAQGVQVFDPCDANATCISLGSEYKCIGGDSNINTGPQGNSGYCGIPAPEGPQTAGSILQIIQRVGNWVFAFFLAISIIFLIWGAFEFVTGEGNPEKVSSAKRRLIYAVIGIGLALLANSVPAVLRSIII